MCVWENIYLYEGRRSIVWQKKKKDSTVMWLLCLYAFEIGRKDLQLVTAEIQSLGEHLNFLPH